MLKTFTRLKYFCQSKFFSASALLAVSALFAKILGLWRDRLLVQFFAESDQLDLVFAAFRIPDFFFFLLISGTVATLFLPRYADLKDTVERSQFFQSFLTLFVVFFGGVCFFGIFLAPYLARIFSPGLDLVAQTEIASLTQYLFSSVFLLCVSSVFSARLQAEKIFWPIAISPIFYTAFLCFVLLYTHSSYGLLAVGYGAISGAFVHLLINAGAVLFRRNRVFCKPFVFLLWQPVSAWKYFSTDFGARVLNGSVFQVNQTIDVVIASFLVAGSISAFTLGTALGHFLLSIVGFSVAKVLFAELAEAKKNRDQQRRILKKGVLVILLLTVPATIIAIGFSEWLLSTFLTLSGEKLRLTNIVFVWTVASLPAACLCPLLSQAFLAQGDTKTPLVSAAIALFIATVIAAALSLIILPSSSAILGLALGNFLANHVNALFLSWKIYFSRVS